MSQLTLLVMVICLLPLLCAEGSAARPQVTIPEDFPRFIVPGQERAMAELRELYWVHYERGGPLATLWDEWESTPTLWPAVTTDNRLQTIRDRWRQALLSRGMDAEGYVFTHQHGSIAHQEGWPFPFWVQGKHTWGWHFSIKLEGVPPGYQPREAKNQDGWTAAGMRDLGIDDAGWQLELTAPDATLTTPTMEVHPDEAPFVQVRWRAEGLGSAQPYVMWETAEQPGFGRERMMHFDAPAGSGYTYAMVPVYRHPQWTGTITRLRIGCGNPAAGGRVGVQAVFTNYDTRHTINNQNFVRGSAHYFHWSGDTGFLRANIQRMRLAMRYLMVDLGGLQHKSITVPWVGHDGRPGYTLRKDGSKEMHPGRGIGNNYWDLLPMGYHDAYATIQYYDALLAMATVERETAAHPEWSIPGGPLALDPGQLERHAAEVKAAGNKLFWNEETGRFTTGPDIDGKSYDFGFVFLNMEAVYYDFATPAHAKSIMAWVSGARTVAGDTSQGEDIYHWRFGPRATTRRNVEYYLWAWSGPEKIPWGGQVQDGGGVLGFELFDLMGRLRWLGPNDCERRLQAVVEWYREVQEAGGPREYYKDGTRGTLQGGNTAGGLGIDMEFFESILVPQIMTQGFLGMRATAEGLRFSPTLPKAWPSLTVTGIHWHDLVLDVTATNESLTVTSRQPCDAVAAITLPKGAWRATAYDAGGKGLGAVEGLARVVDMAFVVDWGKAAKLEVRRS